MSLTIIDHPLARHYLTHLRDSATKPALFRTLARKLSTLIAIEASRSFRTTSVPVNTPLETISADILVDDLVVIPILRAGLGMVDGIIELFPEVSVGYFGLERDEKTAKASSYYCKLPDLCGKTVLLVDPMLATGGSAASALRDIFRQGPRSVKLLCIVAAPEGIAALMGEFPELDIFNSSQDRELDARKYILPGLGDFGDRLYGTGG